MLWNCNQVKIIIARPRNVFVIARPCNVIQFHTSLYALGTMDGPATALLSVACGLRKHKRRRRSINDINVALGGRSAPKWLRRLLECALALHRCVLITSEPMGRHNRDVMGVGRYGMTKHALMALRRTGFVQGRRPNLRVLQREQQRSNQLTKQSSHVLWLDNYFVKRFSQKGENACKDMTAIAIIAVAPILRRWHWPTVMELRACFDDCVRSAMATWDAQDLWVAAHVHQWPLQNELRVPLDCTRDPATANQVKWQPLEVVGAACGELIGLLQCLSVVKTLRGRAMSTIPLVLDQNLYWRYLKLVYSSTYHEVNARMRYALDGMPPVCALWHVYKHCLVIWFRQFSPFLGMLHHFLHSRRPHMRRAMKAEPKIYAIEILACSIASTVTQDYIEELHRRRNAAPPGSALHIRWCYLTSLLLVSTPWLIRIGIAIRSCTWRPDQSASSVIPLRVLYECLRFLLSFQPETSSVYIREICVAVMLQAARPLAISPHGWQEESCEAMLSIVGRQRGTVLLQSLQEYRKYFLSVRRADRLPEHLRDPCHVYTAGVQRWLEHCLDVVGTGRGQMFRRPHGGDENPRLLVLCDMSELPPMQIAHPCNAERVARVLQRALDALVSAVHIELSPAVVLRAIQAPFPEEVLSDDDDDGAVPAPRIDVPAPAPHLAVDETATETSDSSSDSSSSDSDDTSSSSDSA